MTAPISGREAEVLAAVGEHLTNAEIAQRLHISIRTVESHVSSLLRKLGAEDRRELAARAGEQALPAFRALPTAWTSFVGRAAELVEVVATVRDHRLVMLQGPGGIGKTRLSMAAVEQLAPRSGAFVDLVPVTEGGMLAAVAGALGVVEQPGASLAGLVHEQLRSGPSLVVLDNCEHVLGPAAAWAEAALAACPELSVLATSRERLGLRGERVLLIPPLAEEGTSLFLERAAVDGVDEGVVREICRRLDGMPLAIELAAARLPSLGVDGLTAALDDHLRLLGGSGGPPGRHGSLRAVLEWSHELLDPEERSAFRRLSAFAASFDLPAAAAVVGVEPVVAGDVVGRLADKSLLVRGEDHGASRWRLLETVRAYAVEQLDASGEGPAVEEAHLRWAIGTATALEADLEAGTAWRARFDDVADDLRVAAARSASPELDRTLGHLTYAHGLLAESHDHFVSAAERAIGAVEALAAWQAAAAVARIDQRFLLAAEDLRRGAEVAAAAGDGRGASLALAEVVRDVGRFPASLGQLPGDEAVRSTLERARELAPPDDPETAVALALATAWSAEPRPTEPDADLAEEALALARAHGDPLLISEALDAIGSAASWAGRYREAARVNAERLALLDGLPRHRPEGGLEVLDAHLMTTMSAVQAGDLRGSLAMGRRAHPDLVARAMPYQAASHIVLPLVLLGEFDEALDEGDVMRETWQRAGRPTAGWLAAAVFSVALVHGVRGDADAYDDWWRLGVELCSHAPAINGMGHYVEHRVALHTGVLDVGHVDVGSLTHFPDYAEVMAVEVAVVRGDRDADERLDAARRIAVENDVAAAILLRAEGRRDGDRARLEASVAAWEAIGARYERASTLTLLPDRRAEGDDELAALGCR
jgi:predicted ATPase/DNA-binding CsgD family transcriptional regulator